MALVPNLNNIYFVIEKTLLLSTQTGGAVSGARVWGACISMFATLNKAQDRVGPPPSQCKYQLFQQYIVIVMTTLPLTMEGGWCR